MYHPSIIGAAINEVAGEQQGSSRQIHSKLDCPYTVIQGIDEKHSKTRFRRITNNHRPIPSESVELISGINPIPTYTT